MSGFPQGPVLGPILFISAIDNCIECTLSKFMVDTKANIIAAFQRDLDKFKKQLHMNFMRFNKATPSTRHDHFVAIFKDKTLTTHTGKLGNKKIFRY